MDTSARINAFSKLGVELLTRLENKDESLYKAIEHARALNHWFTEDNISFSLKSIALMLNEDVLKKWLSSYEVQSQNKRVGIIMAGNIPLVGFHDFLTVLISGNKAVIKMSSEDKILLPYLTTLLIDIESRYSPYIELLGHVMPKDIEGIIATGSNNSARYFDYYFGKYPNVIRKNRSSVAVIIGDEKEEELKLLGEDIFKFFGLGCRNVSKVYLPKDYKVDNIFEAIYDYRNVLNHNKYANNYTYQRALLLMDSAIFFDNNFLIMKESRMIVSPIGVLHFEYYNSISDVETELESMNDQIQCVVCNSERLKFSRKVAIGSAQTPNINDYADGLDTMNFLVKL